MSYFSLEDVRAAAHMRAVQAYHATAHVAARGGLARIEPNPVDMDQYDLHRPTGSYSDVF
ncbi:hypothetical protein ACGFYQ_27425 [Streptomyces sp. NPDC048258]|uniref:hypothetical protein n=1 Tax=Streptomyces sp. NPDC048258 TaxID=3365527 RepID=UPI003710D1E9